MRIFLDTHVWMWWVTEDPRLSRRARSIIRKAVAGEGVWISAISIWEMAKKVEKGALALDRPLKQWVEDALSRPGVYVAELSSAILIESCELPGPFHGDPADQIIVASARHHHALLITKDRRLHDYPNVQCRW